MRERIGDSSTNGVISTSAEFEFVDLVTDDQVGGDSVIQDPSTFGQWELECRAGFDIAAWLKFQAIGVGHQIVASDAGRT